MGGGKSQQRLTDISHLSARFVQALNIPLHGQRQQQAAHEQADDEQHDRQLDERETAFVMRRLRDG